MLCSCKLKRILGNQGFAQTHRIRRFLEYVVNAVAAGGSDQVKEYAIGVEVFGRRQNLDPRVDPIVRVQAAKLRWKLIEYYASDGANNTIIIAIPKRRYTAVVETAAAEIGSC